jgi:hypothetical protein
VEETGREEHSQFLRSPRSLDTLQVKDDDDSRREPLNRRREDLELDILMQERPLPRQCCRSGSSCAGEDH